MMPLAVSFAEKRRAAGIATSATAPIVLVRLRPTVARVAERQDAVCVSRPEPTETHQSADVGRPVGKMDATAGGALRHACPAPVTRELLAARSGITYKDVAGEREADLVRRYQAGDRHAGEVLLRAHAGVIAQQAKRYQGKWHDLDREDVLAEAQIGFLDAVRRFKPDSGTPLSAYAALWIRANTLSSIQSTGTAIRVPSNQHMRLRRGADDARARFAGNALSLHRLDAPVGEDDSVTLGDFVAAPDDGPEEKLAKCELEHASINALRSAMSTLHPRMADVLRRRMAGETAGAIGEAYGVSSARVFDIERAAKVRLRARVVATMTGRSPVARLNADPSRSPTTAPIGASPKLEPEQRGRCRICARDDHNTPTCERWAGRRFGRLVVLRGAKAPGRKGGYVLAKCDCGNEKVVSGSHLESGKTGSCGCLRAEWLTWARSGALKKRKAA